MITSGQGEFGAGEYAIEYDEKPGSVIYFTNEGNDIDDIKPSFIAQGGNTDLLFRVRFKNENGIQNFNPASEEHIAHLTAAIKQKDRFPNLKLIILDSIISILDEPKLAFNDVAVRKKLETLNTIINQTGVSIFGIKHFLKRSRAQGGQAKDQDAGSTAWSDFSRMTMTIMHKWIKDENGQDERQLYLLKTKTNKANLEGAWQFKLYQHHLNIKQKDTPDTWHDDINCAHFIDYHPNLKADHLMNEPALPVKDKNTEEHKKDTKEDIAKKLIIQCLNDFNYHFPEQEYLNGNDMAQWLYNKRKENNLHISDSTLQKARANLVQAGVIEKEKDGQHKSQYKILSLIHI